MTDIKKKRRLSKIVFDERSLMKLLRNATGLKVFKAERTPIYNNLYYAITQEYKCDKPHIQVVQGSWCSKTGGDYKISIFTPTLKVDSQYRLNASFAQQIIDKIQEALNNEFGSENWTHCNNEQRIWTPMSRNSFYIQIPNFDND